MYKVALLITIYFYRSLSFILFFFLKEKKGKTILYFSAFFPENSGYNWRVKKWERLLMKENYKVTISSATNKKDFYSILQTNRSLFFIKYLHKRFWQIIASRNYERVIVRRELLLYNDYGNLFLDKFLLKIHPNAILDFDDDIAFAKREPRKIKSLYAKLLQENGNKFTESINLYQNFIVGSEYLKNYVLEKNSSANIEVIPTCVDYEKYTPKLYDKNKEEIVFGWIGGNHNLFLLENIIEPLNKIAKKNKISLLVIAGREYKNANANFPIVNKLWSLETEIEDMKSMDIGLMPLLNTPRDYGKAGFKLIQYMGLGIVSVASAVTVNCDIVDDGKNGFLVYNNWSEVLKKVVNKKPNYREIGIQSRKQIIKNYSFLANIKKYILFISP